MIRQIHWSPYRNDETISNKLPIKPSNKGEPPLTSWGAWEGGYPFDRFLGATYAYLGELAALEGIQQLCHHYYLQNGMLGARTTANRIKKFLGNDSNDQSTEGK